MLFFSPPYHQKVGCSDHYASVVRSVNPSVRLSIRLLTFSCYRNFSETNRGIASKLHIQAPDDVVLCLTEFRTNPTSKMAAMAAILKIMLSLLLKNYCMDFNQIPHIGSWGCLFVPNLISDRSGIQDGRHSSYLENLAIATPQKLLDGF